MKISRLKSTIIVLLLPAVVIFAFGGLKTRLGSEINTDATELAPVISADHSTLFFSRQGHQANRGHKVRKDDQDIWMSKRGKNGGWLPAIHVNASFNNSSYNYPIATSPDGKTLYMANVYKPGGGTAKGISWSKFENGRWSFPQPLQIENYYNKSAFSTFSMGAGENSLVMAVRRNDSYGREDLYVSHKQANGKYSRPLNLGRQINTEYDETTPYLAPDGRTLYFSSNRPQGQGLYDIYLSRRHGSGWKNWSEPENLGRRVNTRGNDYYFFVAPSQDYAMLVSNGDIFRVELPRRLQPAATSIVYGSVENSSGEPLSATVVYENLQNGQVIGKAFSDKNTGQYSLILRQKGFYGVRAEKEGYISVNQNVDLSTGPANRNRKIVMYKIRAGSQVVMNNVFFQKNSARLSPQSFAELNRLVKLLKTRKSMVIEIRGHTDNRGSKALNYQLSVDRAGSVRAYLLKNGIARKRVTSRGFGDSRPMASNETEKGRKLNRRVELKILF